jgi:hypothetical protein
MSDITPLILDANGDQEHAQKALAELYDKKDQTEQMIFVEVYKDSNDLLKDKLVMRTHYKNKWFTLFIETTALKNHTGWFFDFAVAEIRANRKNAKVKASISTCFASNVHKFIKEFYALTEEKEKAWRTTQAERSLRALEEDRRLLLKGQIAILSNGRHVRLDK